MAVYNINVPEGNSLDQLAEQREQRDQRTRARMSRKAYIDDILVRLADELFDERSALGEVVEMLFEAPIRDEYDRKAFLTLRDGQRLGQAVLQVVTEASLAAYQDADAEGF